MRLTAVHQRWQRFPDSTRSPFVELVFEQDGEIVRKHIRISFCAQSVSRGLTVEARRLVAKTALEASRDFAYAKGGIEAVRKITRESFSLEAQELSKAVELLTA